MSKPHRSAGSVLVLGVLIAASLVGSAGASRARAATGICVSGGGGCYQTLQAAFAAAHAGDTIRIASGTFAGGATVDASVTIIGAGAGRTIIRGGGPVLTIGEPGALSEPTVLIEGLTITGGMNTSVPSTFRTHGGGIFVAPSADLAGSATVTIKDSIVTGNRVAPSATFPSPSGVICPGGGFCPFAIAAGGAIYNTGTMTLDHTTVSNNSAGTAQGVDPLASDADGGGIDTDVGSLTLIDSTVSNNSARAVPPDGRFAEGGGIFMSEGTSLTVHHSAISGNSTLLSATFPHPYPEQGGGTDGMASNGGGIHVSDGGSTIVDGSHIDDNTITVSDLAGEPVGFDAALCTCGENSLVVRDSTMDGNRVVATVGSQSDVGPSGPAAIEFDGPATVTDTRISGNSTTVTSPGGDAEALGAVGGFQVSPDTASITDSVIGDNSVTASSTTGSATVQGAGLTNDGVLLLKDDRIENNHGTAAAPTASGQGGGIFNGVVFGQPPVQLTLQDTTVAGNTLRGSPDSSLQGGGLYTPGFPITLHDSPIEGNTPDQCYGC